MASTRSYDRLILTSGQTYTIPAGDTINVLSYISGDWDGAVFVSSASGTPFNLNVPSGGITVISCSFTDCNASGGGVIDATSGGTNGGGNTNILFPATAASNNNRKKLWYSISSFRI
jgi:hypothetical protein